jgi:thiamine biosynthesis lipoprotein
MDYHQFRAMNTDILLAAEGDKDLMAKGFEQAQEFIQISEERFTRFSNESELAQLNQNAGSWFQASYDLFEILKLAQKFTKETNGLFNPAILQALEYAGYDRSIDEIRENGVLYQGEMEEKRVPDFMEVEFDEDEQRILLPPGMQADLGGIAKGWIAERAAYLLKSYTTACGVNAGGDMYLVGLPSGEEAWQISLEDPRNPDQVLEILNVKAGAVATSSITRRSWMKGGQRQHHLIDPRTGQPAQTDWLSVTVISPRAATAEVYAKSLLIAGSQNYELILAYHKDLEFIAVDAQGNLWGSSNSKEYIYDANASISRQ